MSRGSSPLRICDPAAYGPRPPLSVLSADRLAILACQRTEEAQRRGQRGNPGRAAPGRARQEETRTIAPRPPSAEATRGQSRAVNTCRGRGGFAGPRVGAPRWVAASSTAIAMVRTTKTDTPAVRRRPSRPWPHARPARTATTRGRACRCARSRRATGRGSRSPSTMSRPPADRPSGSARDEGEGEDRR
jgi:hypothetical protein